MAVQRKPGQELQTIGWREWLSLPDLGIERLKVKVDTGARTSSLHAFDIKSHEDGGVTWVRFRIHPLQNDSDTVVEARAPLVDERRVRPSTGGVQLRPVIRTRAVLGSDVWPIELTLVNRGEMGFRMLLGRQALRNRFLVDPGGSFLKPPGDES